MWGLSRGSLMCDITYGCMTGNDTVALQWCSPLRPFCSHSCTRQQGRAKCQGQEVSGYSDVLDSLHQTIPPRYSDHLWLEEKMLNTQFISLNNSCKLQSLSGLTCLTTKGGLESDSALNFTDLKLKGESCCWLSLPKSWEYFSGLGDGERDPKDLENLLQMLFLLVALRRMGEMLLRWGDAEVTLRNLILLLSWKIH